MPGWDPSWTSHVTAVTTDMSYDDLRDEDDRTRGVFRGFLRRPDTVEANERLTGPQQGIAVNHATEGATVIPLLHVDEVAELQTAAATGGELLWPAATWGETWQGVSTLPSLLTDEVLAEDDAAGQLLAADAALMDDL